MYVYGYVDVHVCYEMDMSATTSYVGGRDMGVHLWDTRTNQHVYTLKGHRDTITGVAFQKGTQQLFR